MIEPISSNGKDITDIKFCDCFKGWKPNGEEKPCFCKSNHKRKLKYEKCRFNCGFQLLIPVEKLEDVLMGIANYLIDKASSA